MFQDVAYRLGTVATITDLMRTKQDQFELEDVLEKEDLSMENIYRVIDDWNDTLKNYDVKCKETNLKKCTLSL